MESDNSPLELARHIRSALAEFSQPAWRQSETNPNRWATVIKCLEQILPALKANGIDTLAVQTIVAVAYSLPLYVQRPPDDRSPHRIAPQFHAAMTELGDELWRQAAVAVYKLQSMDLPADAPAGRTWIDPSNGTPYTFDTDHQSEVWTAFATSRYPVTLSHLCDTVQRWKEQCALPDTATAYIKTLRTWWRNKGRADIADCIKLTRETVEFRAAKDN